MQNFKASNFVIPAIVFVVILFLIFINSFFVIIEPGNVGVSVTLGNVNSNVLQPGFHLKNPLTQVTTYSTRTEEYTMSRAMNEGTRPNDDSIDVLSADGLQLSLDVTVLYRLKSEEAAKVFTNLPVDYAETFIRPQIRSNIREVMSKYNVIEIYTTKRDETQTKIFDELKAALEVRGFVLEDVLLRDVKLPESLSASIAQKLSAQQDAERVNFEIEKAKKEAERKVIEAQGQRDAQRIINESLTPNYLNYLYIQNLQNRQGTIYVPTDPSTGIPVFRGL